MEKFHNIPLEKQNTIINAALETFGTNGYKKTSVSDIAAAAGISKAMVFHYFGTKKELYFYLLNHCGNLLMGEITEKFNHNITDFFDRIKMATDIKMSVIKKHPAILSYLYSVYFETNEEVSGDILDLLSKSNSLKNTIALEGMDYSKFKEGVDVSLLMKMLNWMAEGFSGPSKSIKESELDAKLEEFYEAMELMRKNLYKEEYL